MSSFEILGTHKPDNLIAGHEIPMLTTGVLLKGGQGVLKRGSVIGVITAEDKGRLCAKGAEDGSQVAKVVLSHDVETTPGDVMAVCWKTGLFTRTALIFGGDDTADDHEGELQDVGIYLRDELQY